MFHFKREKDEAPNLSAAGARISKADEDKTSTLPAQAPEEPLEGSDAEAYAALKRKRAERRRKKIIRRGIIAGSLVAVVAVIAIVLSVLSQSPTEEMEPITDMVTRGTYANEIEASGTLEARSSTVITPEVDGTIAEVRVSAGQYVKKGDVLMVLKNDELDRGVTEAQRNLDAARSDLAAAERNLAEAGNAPTSITDPETGEVTDIPQDTSSLRDAVTAARRAVEAAQESYDQAVALAAKRTVASPIDGNVVESNAKVGAKLSDIAQSNTSLMQVADLSQMKVTIQVAEQDIAKVAVDQNGTITFPAFDGLELTGKVSAIASVATGTGQEYYGGMGGSPTFAVDVVITEPDARLKPGMTASVTLTTERYDDVIIVPFIALMTDDGEHYYVNREIDPETHTYEQVPIEVVAQNNEIACIGKPAGSASDGDPNTPAGEDGADDPNANLPEAALSEGDVLVISGGELGGADEPAASGGVMIG